MRSVTRLFGATALVWTLWLLEHPPTMLRHVFMVAWVALCGVLIHGRRPIAGGFALAMLALIGVILGDQPAGPALVFWIGLTVAVTEGHPQDRALLLRVCATCVYAFAVLSKLNPAWLSGDQIVYIAQTRPLLEAHVGTVRTVATWVAGATLVAEAAIPLALWGHRTRLAGAVLGVLMHVALIVVATRSVGSAAELVVINGLLVLAYAGFFAEEGGRLRPLRQASSASVG